MLPLLRAFAEIATLRRNPQDLPASPFLLTLALGADLLLTVVAELYRWPALQAVVHATLAVLFLAAYTVFLLFLRDKLPRAIQSVTALAGVDAVVTVFQIPVVIAHSQLDPSQADPTQGDLFLFFLSVTLLVWGLAAFSHCLRHALSMEVWLAFLTAISYFWITDRLIVGIVDLFPG
jgi:hypothetical protein